MDRDKKPDLRNEIAEALLHKTTPDDVRKISNELITKRIVEASKTFLDTVGVESALDILRSDVYGNGYISYSTETYEYQESGGGGSTSLRGGPYSERWSIEHRGFFTGYLYEGMSLSLYGRDFRDKDIFIGFVGMQVEKNPRILTDFIIATMYPNHSMVHLLAYTEQFGSHSIAGNLLRRIKLDTDSQLGNSPEEKVVNFLSPANTSFAQKIRSATIDSVAGIIKNEKKY